MLSISNYLFFKKSFFKYVVILKNLVFQNAFRYFIFRNFFFNSHSTTEYWKPLVLLKLYRSSHRRCFFKKGVLRNFAKFTGKHLCQSLFFIKKKINFIKKETLAQVLSCKFCKISKNTFSENTSRRLLLTVVRDISNAFYSAWHTGLLYKFRLYGVRCFIFMSHPVVVKKF